VLLLSSVGAPFSRVVRICTHSCNNENKASLGVGGIKVHSIGCASAIKGAKRLSHFNVQTQGAGSLTQNACTVSILKSCQLPLLARTKASRYTRKTQDDCVKTSFLKQQLQRNFMCLTVRFLGRLS